jgi:hypothetical protein
MRRDARRNQGKPLAWFQTMLLNDRYSGRCGEEFDQRRGTVRLLRRSVNAARIYGDVLDLCWQRPKNFDALHANELAHLVKSDLGVAARVEREHQ